MRALSGNSTRLRVYQFGGTGGTTVAKSVGPEWTTVFHTWEIGGEPTELSVHIYPDGSTLEIAGCWLTRTSTPGRACWGGEAPVTCGADRHIVSTEGWPTTAGEVSVVFRLDAIAGQVALIDGRSTTSGLTTVFVENRRLRVFMAGFNSGPIGPLLEAGKTYRLRLWADSGGMYMSLDGVQVLHRPGIPLSWSSAAHLGNSVLGIEQINGSIRSLIVRSYEEVSP